MKIAAHYMVSFRNTLSKSELQVLLVDSLHKQGVFGDEEKLVDYPESAEGSEDLALQVRKLELQVKERDEALREREEWEREKEKRRERERHELELKKLEMEQACRLKEIELKARERCVTGCF
ncbi:hypothetical protein QQF64_009057 [Cirrhinus molitorella]|uniref:Uncharacterized protein n=1 Tax=Cirrhinus molitorella TaxID=172907 RepID=A0ABR3M7Y8_9TELE